MTALTSSGSSARSPRAYSLKGVGAGRMVDENPVGQGGHGTELGGVGRPAEVSNGWTKVWSCERHADELVSARRVIGKPFAG
jgi:hypothetical protein